MFQKDLSEEILRNVKAIFKANMEMSQTEPVESDSGLIIVFAKDRLDRLHKTLPYLSRIPYNAHLIDDSTSPSTQTAIRRLCNEFCIKYHGLAEQDNVFKQFDEVALKKFVTRLSKNEWSLGCNRNYAVVYGLYLGARKVIFMDDDVIVDTKLLRTIFEGLSRVPFLGVQITGMPDHSIVGHIYRAGAHTLPQYVSGTFLGIDLQKVTHYFLNIYNEDWIWLFLENNGKMVDKIGSVKQLTYDPFKGWISKIYFQEFGEILWDGLYYHSPPIRESTLIREDYWQDVLKIRMRELTSIATLQLPDDLKPTAIAIQNSLFEFHRTLPPNIFSNQFKRYFERLGDWRSLLASLSDSRKE